jgi:tol-pal system protein YbgF
MRNPVRSTAVRLLGTAAAVLTMGGCATKGDIRSMRMELRDLALRQDSVMSELRRETLTTQDTLRGQADQLFDFRGSIARQLQDISASLQRLEAMVGENQRGISGVRDQLANIRRGGPTTPTGPGGAAEDSTSAPMIQPQQDTGEATATFNAAVSQYNRGSLATASRAFESFLQAYPNHPLAPVARFDIADILEQQGHQDDALAAFQKIQELYPTADKVPEALYRVALLQIIKGKKADARATLQRIINTYPDADIASVARDKLAEIR